MTSEQAAARWVRQPGYVCYQSSPATEVDLQHYKDLRAKAVKRVLDLTVPAKQGRAWTMQRGDLCRVSLPAGPQVGDLNFWNFHNTTEHFYSGKTRQLHAAHLTEGDRLWSCLPFLNPMATVVGDSIKYGVDEDGAGVHDVIGTRCDQYTIKLINGEEVSRSCHQNLTQAIEEFGLQERDVHDVFNIFMCTGFSRKENKYFCKPSPARKGDFIEFIAEMDLIVALSACPQGDVSVPVGHPVPDEICHPLKVEVFKPS